MKAAQQFQERSKKWFGAYELFAEMLNEQRIEFYLFESHHVDVPVWVFRVNILDI